MRSYNKKRVIVGILLLLITTFYYTGIYPFKKNRPYAKTGNYCKYDKLDSNIFLNDNIYITIEAYFENDDVEIRHNDSTVFEKSVTTNDVLGVAKSIEIVRNKKNKKDYLEIIINRNKPIVVYGIVNYNYILINYHEDMPEITLTNKEKIYK